jgi:hypothetical protein
LDCGEKGNTPLNSSSIEALLLAHRESMHQRGVMINAVSGFEDSELMS